MASEPTDYRVPTTVIDCRWLGFSGVGRVTDLLLDGLAEVRPVGRWVLWGRPELIDRMWPGAEVVLEEASPLARLGQAGLRRLPRGDRYLFLHVVRPLRGRRRAAVLAHDTIPVRFASPRWKRPLQRAFYAVSVHTAGWVMAYSDATTANLSRDLGLRPDRVRRIDLTVDLRIASEARAIRAARREEGYLLYVGLDRPQKNLDRALAAFGRTRFAAGGGRFVLAGIQEYAVADVERRAAEVGARVNVRSRCSDAELVQLYAGAAALIVPSLEEGLGLPVIEGLAAGVPVCCSGTGALAEASRGLAETFDPLAVGDIAAAIDRAVSLGGSAHWADRVRQFDAEIALPTPAEFARQVLGVLDG